MIITDIIPLGKQNFLVQFSNQEELLLRRKDIEQYKITDGKQMEQSDYDFLVEMVVYPYARDRAFRYLSYRGRTEKEVLDYLRKQRFSDKIVARVMAFLVEYGYVNDRLYMENYIRSHKQLGIQGIRYKLRLKGISPTVMEEVLSEREEDEELENCLALLQKRLKGRELSFEERNKHMAYLQRRGFKYSTINETIRLYNKQKDS